MSKESTNDESSKDFEVEMVARNGHILARMRELKMLQGNRPSVNMLIERMGRRSTGSDGLEVQNLVRLKLAPTDEVGDWTTLVLKVAEALKTTPEQLFPNALKHRTPKQSSKTVTSNIGEEAKWLVMASP